MPLQLVVRPTAADMGSSVQSEPAVTVVVPAYNAGHTVVETLRTVSAQTFHALEIIVVDDGSTDNTAEVVERYCSVEPRLRLVRQANGGVAAARNTGMQHASAPLIAPLDSDDLWHPTKLEKHVAALQKNPDAAFVYSPFRILNGDGKIIGNHPFFAFSGRVFYRQLFFNMVGNGSGMTFRKDVALKLGGYDTSLRTAGLQGCEDWLLQMLMSIDHEVAHVPEYLIGYRKVPGAMSSDTDRMWRSRIMATEILEQRAPPSAQEFLDSAKLSFSMRLALQSLRNTGPKQMIDTVGALVMRRPAPRVVDELFEAFARRNRRARNGKPGALFKDVAPATRVRDHLSPYTLRLIERLRAADEAPALRDQPLRVAAKA
jgi:hypothetical protein